MNFVIVGEMSKPEDGGVEELTHKYAKGLSELGNEVSFISEPKDGDDNFDGKQRYKIVRESINEKERGVFIHCEERRGIERHIQNERADFVLANYIGTRLGNLSLAAAAAARRSSVPFGVLAHGMEFLADGMLPHFLRAGTLFGASAVISSSQYTAELVRSDPLVFAPVKVINPGIDTSAYLDPDPTDFEERFGEDENIIGTLSRLVERKGHDTVIKALPEILDNQPNTKYIIAGTGPYKSNLIDLAERVGVQDHVYFLGRIDEKDKPGFLSYCDFFAMPSRVTAENSVEGFGIVFLEAAACGTVCVASDSGGISDAVDFGETGISVDPLDPGGVSSAIIHLMENPDLKRDMERRGKERVFGSFDYVDKCRELEELAKACHNR